MNLKKISKSVEMTVAKASFSLRKDLQKLLISAHLREKNKNAKKALSWILDNANEAEREKIAICQDTGFPIVFIEAGRGVRISSAIIDAIKKGVEAGYRKNYLRASIVDPIERGKPSYKGGIYHIDFSSSFKNIKVTIFPKGFGSENKCQLKMFNPTAALSEIEDFIVASAKKAGPEACPPFVVGVGIGGSSDFAQLLAKKALLGELGKNSPDRVLKGLEKRLLKKINSLNIGPMGLGGKNTCLAVKIKKSSTHIAGLPVGVNISCHALRSATINLKI